MDMHLSRSTEDSMIGGVCGGIGEHYQIDSTIIRLIWVLVSVFAGAGIVLYIVAWYVMPNEYGRRSALPLALLLILLVPTLCGMCCGVTSFFGSAGGW